MFWQFKGIPEHFADIVHMNLTLLINITFFSDAETKVLKYGGFKTDSMPHPANGNVFNAKTF